MTGRQTVDESQLFALGAFAAPVTHPRAALADIRGAPAAGGHRRSACRKWPLRKPATFPSTAGRVAQDHRRKGKAGISAEFARLKPLFAGALTRDGWRGTCATSLARTCGIRYAHPIGQVCAAA
jgi:hypothetical protein